jgi:hypothetical protein
MTMEANRPLLRFQGVDFHSMGSEFAAWWILQHVRDFKPFRTEIRHLVTLKGDLDY